jgi:DnaK suppressor protein
LALQRALLLCELATRLDQDVAHRQAEPSPTAHTDADGRWERVISAGAAALPNRALEDVRHALARLDDGTYGFCGHCRRPIPFERLEATPHARLCVGCAGPP